MSPEHSADRGPRGAGDPADREVRDPRSYVASGEDGGPPDQGGEDGQGGGRRGEPGEDGRGDGKGRKKGLSQHPAVIAIGVIVLVVLVVLVVLYWLHAHDFESTDDAFVDTHLVRVAPRIAGRVDAVLVEDNQQVKAGQPLLRIDPRDYQARLDQAQATRAQADAQIAQAQAQLVQIGAQVEVNEANVRQAQAAAVSNAAQADYAAGDLARYRALKSVNPSAVAQQQLDQASAQAASTAAQREAALRQVAAVRAQVRATASQRSGALAQIGAANAQKQSAQAQIRSAQLDLSYAEVVAPEAGTVAQRSVAIGAYVSPGAQIMALVPLRTWITANFKETQLARMRPGQAAAVHVDACPQARISGHVDSIQRGSGQAFAILPPENATGNFVKVVQRVPVKILLDTPPADCPLGPGLSVEPKVRVR